MMGSRQIEWKRIGKLSGCSVYRSSDGEMAIERDFEILCEMTPEEKAEYQSQGLCRKELDGEESK